MFLSLVPCEASDMLPPPGRCPHRNLGSGKSPSRRERPPTPVFLPGESHGQRSLEGSIESDTTEATYTSTLKRGAKSCGTTNPGRQFEPFHDPNLSCTLQTSNCRYLSPWPDFLSMFLRDSGIRGPLRRPVWHPLELQGSLLSELIFILCMCFHIVIEHFKMFVDNIPIRYKFQKIE